MSTPETKPTRGHVATILNHLGTVQRGLAWVSNHLAATRRDWYTDSKIDEVLAEVSMIEVQIQSVRKQLELRKSKVQAATPPAPTVT